MQRRARGSQRGRPPELRLVRAQVQALLMVLPPGRPMDLGPVRQQGVDSVRQLGRDRRQAEGLLG